MIKLIVFYLLHGILGICQIAVFVGLAWWFILWIAWVSDHSTRFLTQGTSIDMWPQEDTPGFRLFFWGSWFIIMFSVMLLVGYVRADILG